MGQETRTTEVLGPKCVIETGNPQMGMSGRDSTKILCTNDMAMRFILSHTESGLSKITTEGTVQVEAAGSPKLSEGVVAYEIIAHKGDFALNVDKGSTKVYARQIVLQASKEIVIDAPNIRIGSDNDGATKDIKIIGQHVDIKSKKGNLANSLMESSYLKAFDGTLVSDLALIASGSPLAAAAKVGAEVAKKLFG